MHYACQFNNEFAVKWLWSQGIPIDNVDKMKYSPIMFACQSGNLDIVKFLIVNGADSKRVFKNSRTRNFQNPTRTMLHFACESGNPEIIKLFIDDADVNKQSWDGTPLNIVSKKGSFEAAKYLIEKGADPRICSETLDYPILNAAKNGNLELLKLLVDSGADVNVSDNNKMTALRLSFIGNFTDCVLYLISKDAQPKYMDDPPLLYAARKGNFDLVLKLVETNDKIINQRDFEGNNVFHLLGRHEAIETMKELLPIKPQDIPNKVGMTPLLCAAKEGKEESVKFFIENGCNPNFKDAKDFYS